MHQFAQPQQYNVQSVIRTGDRKRLDNTNGRVSEKRDGTLSNKRS